MSRGEIQTSTIQQTKYRREGPLRRPLILASASPQRRRLLLEHGYEFDVAIPPLDEPHDRPDGVSPASFAKAVSFFKAAAIARTQASGLILAADTVVALNDKLYGKPADRDDARRILRSLSGTTHEVITGVTLLDAGSGRRRIESECTRVTMRELTTAEIEEYLNSGAWSSKAGAYGIQDRGDAFVERIEGSFSNVVGLPMERLEQMLAEWER